MVCCIFTSVKVLTHRKEKEVYILCIYVCQPSFGVVEPLCIFAMMCKKCDEMFVYLLVTLCPGYKYSGHSLPLCSVFKKSKK